MIGDDTQTACVSKKSLWTGRVISALPALFLLLNWNLLTLEGTQ